MPFQFQYLELKCYLVFRFSLGKGRKYYVPWTQRTSVKLPGETMYHSETWWGKEMKITSSVLDDNVSLTGQLFKVMLK